MLLCHDSFLNLAMDALRDLFSMSRVATTHNFKLSNDSSHFSESLDRTGFHESEKSTANEYTYGKFVGKC